MHNRAYAQQQDRRHQAALLKIAITLRHHKMKGFEETFCDILKEMELDELEFRQYVNSHLTTLMATVRQR